MKKIASPQDLSAALQRILARTEGPGRPSREKLAAELRELAAGTDPKKDGEDEDAKKDDEGDKKLPFPGAAPPFKKKEAAAGLPAALKQLDKELAAVGKTLKATKKLLKRHPVVGDDWGRGEAAEEQVDNLLKALTREYYDAALIFGVYADNAMQDRK